MKPSVAFEIPIGVREAAIFLGVSIQAVYLWVERKTDSPLPRNGTKHSVSAIGSRTIPRSIQTRGGEWQDQVSMMGSFIDVPTAGYGGCAIG
jgi:hypothetical protein